MLTGNCLLLFSAVAQGHFFTQTSEFDPVMERKIVLLPFFPSKYNSHRKPLPACLFSLTVLISSLIIAAAVFLCLLLFFVF